MSTPRLRWLDIARAFSVIGVVVVHAAGPAWLTELITPWYLGLFFVASGYTYKDAYTAHPWALAKKRFVSLYIPYVGWQLAYLCLHNTFFDLSILSDKAGYLSTVSRRYAPADFFAAARASLTLRGGENMGGALWFLVALMSVNALFCLLSFANSRYFGGREWTRAAMLVALVAAGYTNQTLVSYPLFLNFSMVCVVFFYAGYLFRRYEARVPSGIVPTALAAAVLYLGRGTAPSVVLAGNPLLLIAAVLAGVFVVVQTSKAIATHALLEYIGRNSLMIMATHFVAFKLVSLAIVHAEGLQLYRLAEFPVIGGHGEWWTAYALVGVLVPTAVKFAYDAAVRATTPGPSAGVRPSAGHGPMPQA